MGAVNLPCVDLELGPDGLFQDHKCRENETQMGVEKGDLSHLPQEIELQEPVEVKKVELETVEQLHFENLHFAEPGIKGEEFGLADIAEEPVDHLRVLLWEKVELVEVQLHSLDQFHIVLEIEILLYLTPGALSFPIEVTQLKGLKGNGDQPRGGDRRLVVVGCGVDDSLEVVLEVKVSDSQQSQS